MKRHRLPFRDDMVREIREGRKTVTRRTSERFADWQPGDLVDVCEGLARGAAGAIEYTADAGLAPGDWRWRVSRLAPRYCPAELVRTVLEVVSVEAERTWGALAGIDWMDILPEVDDDEAVREGFADRAAFLDAWRAINGEGTPAMVYRIEFRVRAPNRAHREPL